MFNWRTWYDFYVDAGDFSGPAQSATFTVGSNIPFRASVAEQTGVPQQIFLDECIMTTSPDPNVANDTYTVVTDEGYGLPLLTIKTRPDH